MNIVMILASGSGLRIKNYQIPKQFISIENKPIVMYAFEKFIENKNIDEILIICHPNWIDYLNDMMNKFSYKNNEFHIVKGGSTRNESIKNGLNYIIEKFEILDNDIIITHDAARIFTSQNIINKNIECAEKYGAVDTVVPAVDTIICSLADNKISSVPNRKHLFNGQTPQTFKFSILNNIYKNNCEDTSDACYLAIEKGYDVHLVKGEYSNIKITNDFDLNIAEFMLKKNDKL